LKPRLYTDLQVTFTPAALDERFGFTLGVNNLFDANPPECFSCQLNGFDPTTFDLPGQFFYGRITAKF
jgi:iron complex outermembrane receptor protein